MSNATAQVAQSVNVQSMPLIKKALGDLTAYFKQQKYQLRKEEISGETFLKNLNPRLVDYVNYVENELPFERAKAFYKSAYPLQPIFEKAQDECRNIQEMHRVALISDKELSTKALQIANAFMRVLEGTKTDLELD